MRWPIASGVVDTVLNAGAASAGSSHVAGVAISSADKLQLDTAAVANAVYVNGIAVKASGVVFVATTGGVNTIGGLLVAADGALIVEAGGTPALWVGGMPLNSSGALCVSTVT